MKVLDLVLRSEKLLRIGQSVFKQPAGTTEVSEPLPKKSKGKQTWHKSGEEGEEKHLKGAQELKFHFLSAFLPSIE